MPYMQKVVSDYLRDELGGTRVVAHPPGERARATAWVHVIQPIPAAHSENDPADRLIEFYFQFSCYAGKDGGLPESERLARQVSQSLLMIPGSYTAPTPEDDPIVISRAHLTGPMFMPDNDGFEPARDRHIVNATIHAHSVER